MKEDLIRNNQGGRWTTAPGTNVCKQPLEPYARKAVLPSRRPAERHLSLLEDGRGAKEEDNMSMSQATIRL